MPAEEQIGAKVDRHPNAPEEFVFKTPPHSIEAEQSLLGALLLDNQAWDRVADLVSAEDFYRDDHRRIWRHIARLIEKNQEADVLTVWASIEASPDKDKTGGPAHLGLLAQNTPSALNIRRYAELVKEKAGQRKVAFQATELAEKALAGMTSVLDLAEEGAAAFLGLQGAAETGEAAEFGRAVVEAVERADNPARGLLTGYRDLDRILRGVHAGDLVIIAGRPSMGKTALAMNIAEHVAAQHSTVILSLEMTRAKIAGRSLRYHESKLQRDGALDHLYSLKMFIDDSSTMTLGQARARLRKIQHAHGLSLVVVDYLQLLSGKGENRTQEVSAISRGLKAIAKDLNVVVIAVSQLNRAAENRADNRPMLADLRESGQIEQDADVIAFVYREDYYRPDTPMRGIAEVIVRKNREGGIGTAHLEWQPEFTRFHNLERELPRPNPEPAPRSSVVRADFKQRAAGE